MKKNKMITVIVMTYKNFSGLERTIQSIIKQNYKNVELIVSDDGSDNFRNIFFNKYIDICSYRFVNSKFIHNLKNVGTVKHFNNLIKISNGEIICPLSCGDIFVDNDVLDSIVNHFEETGCLVCTARRKELGESGRVLPKIFELKKLNNCNKALNSVLLFGNFIGGATTYYKKEVFNKLGYFDEQYKLCEDLPFFIKALSNNIQISCLDKITIGYDLSGISSSKKRNDLLDKDYVCIFKNALKNKDIQLSLFTKRALRYRIEKYGTDINRFLLSIKYFDIVIILIISTIVKKWRN